MAIGTTRKGRHIFSGLVFGAMVVAFISCGGSQQGPPQFPPPDVDFFVLNESKSAVEQKYPGIIEGAVNVDIKAQVTGYLEAIYIKEGDYVQAGQTLFKIKGDVYNEQVNNNQAALKTALANQANAKLEIEKLKPLVEGNVVSDMQLATAQASYDATTAQVAQAKAALGSSQINAAFALIKAPVSGYIGRIPNRTGNLVTPSDATPLTTLSEINNVFVYFSMSEADFLPYVRRKKETGTAGAVDLVLADGSVYNHKGTLEIASGNIDRNTGSIAMKAVFPNPDRLLRSGGSARVVIGQTLSSVLVIPMASVKDIQNKYFVYVLGDSSRVNMKPIEISGRSGVNYLVKDGVAPGEKIAFNNIEALHEGATVTSRITTLDSLTTGK